MQIKFYSFTILTSQYDFEPWCNLVQGINITDDLPWKEPFQEPSVAYSGLFMVSSEGRTYKDT